METGSQTMKTGDGTMTEQERRAKYYSRYNSRANSFSVVEKGRLNDFNEPYVKIALVTEEQAENWLRNGDIGNYSK